MTTKMKETPQITQGTQTREATPNLQPETVRSPEKQPQTLEIPITPQVDLVFVSSNHPRSECISDLIAAS